MSSSPPRVQAYATVDSGESDGGKQEGMVHNHPSPSLNPRQRWRRVTLLVRAGRIILDQNKKGTVADVSKQVGSRHRIVVHVHVVLAIQRFKLAAESRKRDLQAVAEQQPKENQCIGQPLACQMQEFVRNILYGRPYQTEHINSDICCAILLVCLVLTAVVVALYFQIVPWPVKINSYTTAYLPANTGTGVIVTCESYLESSADVPDTKNSRNMCLQFKKLETVTVVMFSDPSVKALMSEKIEEENLPKLSITKALEGGLSVTQEAYDLIELVNSTIHAPLAHLFPGGYNQGDYRKVSYVLNLMDFPEDYLLVSWMYDCNNCISCSLEVVRNLRRTMDSSNETSWVNCYYYGGGANKCRTENRYTGKCKVYPPEKLSATFSIRKFLKMFSKLQGIGNIRASEKAHPRKVKFEPNVLYLNISHASSSSVMMRFMEVDRGSPTWTVLSSLFPTVQKDCTKVPRVLVCNGTSVCNMFRNADSYELRCLDFRNYSECKLLFQHNVHIPHYLTHKVEQRGEILCPTGFKCMEEAPYFVVWKTPERMENDALNSFVGSRKLYEEWAKRSGVCTNTYENVIRYDHPHATPDGSVGTSAKESSMPMFLESNCTKETPFQPSYCVPTGRYHTLSDNPGAEWKYLRDDLSLTVATRVEWQRNEPMGFWKWFIGAFGNVFSWVGTGLLVFNLLFGIFACLRGPACIPRDKLKRG